MNILITICGRAGSKGVKNKNIREFLGIPLINYTIGAAELFKERNMQHDIDICVNSDSIELLEIARQQSKEVTIIDRPKELAQDSSPKIPVLQYSLEFLESKFKKKYEYIIDLDITSPYRRIEDIENTLNKAIDKYSVDVVFSVVESRRNPYFNMVEEIDGEIKKVKESNFVARQQAPKVYDMNASIYCFRRDSLMHVLNNSPFDGACDIILMKDTAVLDIDSEEDFELMEVLAEYFFENEFRELYRYVHRSNN